MGDVGVAIFALLFFTALGLFKIRTVRSEESYLFAERKCSVWKLTCTLVMTELNTATLLGFAGLGYLAGLRALYLPLIFLIGLLFYSLTVATKWKELGASSVADLFKCRYGSFVGKVASLFLMVAMVGFSATYVKSIVLIMTPLFPSLQEWHLSLLLVGLMLLMTLRGGLIAIIRTDVASFLLVCALFPLFLYASLKHGNALPFPNSPHLLPNRFIVSLIVLTMFTYILAPWYGQKIFAASSPRVAKQATFISALIVFTLYLIAILAAAFIRTSTLPEISPEMALPTLINTFLPTGVRGLAYILLLMITTTTLAGVWSALSSMAIVDFGVPKKSYRQGLFLTLAFALLSTLLSNVLVDQVLSKLILANIPVAALSFPLLAGFYWKGVTPSGAFISILTGITWGTFTYIYYGETGLYTWHWAIWGIPLIFTSGIAVSLVTAKHLAHPHQGTGN